MAPQNAGFTASARLLLRKLRSLMNEPIGPQVRLDRIVEIIAATMVADVCSIYLHNGKNELELSATEGLTSAAVHRTKLRPGEGLVGLTFGRAQPVNLSDARAHPAFSYRPETGEDPYQSFLGVPILRGGRRLGVLVVQNRSRRQYADDEVEALQTTTTVLAEIVSAANLTAEPIFRDIQLRPQRSEKLQGKGFVEGLAMGVVVLHDPIAPPSALFADDPEREEARIRAALALLSADFEAILTDERLRAPGVLRDVLETQKLLAEDANWADRLIDATRAGLAAEAAIERVRNEHRARLQRARDPYLRERLQDLEAIDNRVLRILAGENTQKVTLPPDAVLVARDISAAELLEYGRDSIRAVLTAEGGATSHAAIVARALGVPMIGRMPDLLNLVEAGDTILVDAERGEIYLRPESELVRSFTDRVAMKAAMRAEFAKIRDLPALSLDNVRIELLLNAGLALDLDQLDASGAEGVGLFRTEFQFMVSSGIPRISEQVALYSAALDRAGDRPVQFRTLDIGSDKAVTYLHAEREENPALGWRAIRMTLGLPGLFRRQLRALIAAAANRHLSVMFPLIANAEEFEAARGFLEAELEWARNHAKQLPSGVSVGAMLEAPSLLWQIPALAGRAQFLSVGTNDLMQYLFAADRTNPRVADRYDFLSPASLSFLHAACEAAHKARIDLSVCGVAAGRPLEAMALIALGFRKLSMPASGIGPVKRMIRSIDISQVRNRLGTLLASGKASLRPDLLIIAQEIRAMI